MGRLMNADQERQDSMIQIDLPKLRLVLTPAELLQALGKVPATFELAIRRGKYDRRFDKEQARRGK